MSNNSTEPLHKGYWPLLIALISLTSLCHAPGLKGSFFSDDFRYLTGNEQLKSLRLVELHRLFTEPMSHGEYLPVRDLVLRLEYEVFGANPLGYHVLSLVLFACCVLLVSHLALQLSSAALGDRARSSRTALICAAFFAFHPANVEAVAWTASQKDLLAAIFILSSLISLTKALVSAPPRLGLLLISWFALAAAMLSKSSALATPMAAALIVMILRTTPRGRLLALMTSVSPMLPLAGLSFLANLAAYQTGQYFVGNGPGVIQTVARAMLILGAQARIALVPVNLRSTYDVYDASSLALYFSLGTLTLVCSLLGAGVLWRRKSLLAFGFAWFPVFLVPILHLKTFQTWSFAGDRYLLMPLFGLSLAAAATIDRILKRHMAPVRKRVVISLATSILLVGLGLSFQRSREWSSLRSLMVANSESAPSHHYSRYLEIHNLLMEGHNFGLAFEAANQVEDPQARDCLLLWIELWQHLRQANVNTELSSAIDSAVTFHSRSRDLLHSSEPRNIPRKVLAQTLLQHANTAYLELRRLTPEDITLIYNHGLLEMQNRNFHAAEELFKRALESGTLPGQRIAPAWNNLGFVLQKQSKVVAAEAAYLEALRVDPGQWRAALNLLLLSDVAELTYSRAEIMEELETRARLSGLDEREIDRLLRELGED